MLLYKRLRLIFISYLIIFFIKRLFLFTSTSTFLLYQHRINQWLILYLIKSFINCKSIITCYNYALKQLIKLLQERQRSFLKLYSVRISFKISLYNIFRGNQYAFIIVPPLAKLAVELLLCPPFLFIAIVLTFKLLYSNQILSLCLHGI